MVNFHIWTLVWILVFLFVFGPIADGNKNTHRGVHNRHGHHHHHRRRHHRKHPKSVHLPPVKQSFSEDTRNTDVTNKILISNHWFPNDTSTSGLLSSSIYSDTEKTTTLENSFNVQNMPNIPIENSNYTTGVSKDINVPKIPEGNYTSGTVKDTNSSSSKNMFKNSQTISTGIIDADFAARDIITSSSPRPWSKELRHGEFANDLEKLFGTMEDRSSLSKILVEAPFVSLIRKKRSDSSEKVEATVDERSRAPTLLDFNGPAIVNDPEETKERDSSESHHIRVKRDGSEVDDLHDALFSSQDSSYLQDLEDSFPLSALEIDAKASPDLENFQRKSRQSESGSGSSMSLVRPKRDDVVSDGVAESQRYEANDIDLAATNESSDSVIETDKVELLKGINDALVSVKSPIEIIKNSSRSTLDDSTTARDMKYAVTSSEASHSDISISRNDDEPITGYRVEDMSLYSPRSENVTKRKAEESDYQPAVPSAADNSSLKDDDPNVRYKLDDVYPEIVDADDPAYRSPIAQLVRTKRFGDAINPEASDDSYANDADNNRIVDEPYAEDDRVIDSMLSKVDYRNPYRSATSGNDEALFELKETGNSLERDQMPIRAQREAFSKRRTRIKAGDARRHSKKRKKSHKERANKRHRHSKRKRTKIKRASEKELEPNDENLSDGKFNGIDQQQVISPHNGKRRRVSEDEDDENFYPDTNQVIASRRDRRHIPESADLDKVPEAVDKKDAKTRDKRDDNLRELKYFQSIRETNGGQNQSEEITGNERFLGEEAAKPIHEIEELAGQLLAKVHELHSFVNEGGGFGATEVSGSPSDIVDRTTGDSSKGVRRVTSTDDSSSRPAKVNDMTRPEACWKWIEQSAGSSKPNGQSARNLRAQRCSKKVRRKRTSHRKWDRWTDWSSCSVTCGRGRQIRWRHCIRNCSTAETEMEEKACQLPACAPGKFLGIFG